VAASAKRSGGVDLDRLLCINFRVVGVFDSMRSGATLRGDGLVRMTEWKRFVRSVLVYFGLAEPPGDPPGPRRPKWFYLLSIVLGVSASMSLQRVLGVGGALSVVLGLFVYVIVLAVVVLLRRPRT
jgi:hypothetical protein